MKKKNIFIGLSLILISVMLILSETNIIPSLNSFAGEISWLAAAVCILLILYVISKLLKGSTGGIFISLSVVFMLIEKNIAIALGRDGHNIINNWLLFLCAVLLEIGFMILLKSLKNPQKISFSSSVVYVDLQKNGKNKFSNKFGELTVRLENSEQFAGEATLHINSKFAETVIEVPSNIYCVCKMQNKFGEISMPQNIADESFPKLIIEGSNFFGEVSIKLV